jgi:hypothetical protein
MPFVYCPKCGIGCYTNVQSCPSCHQPLPAQHTPRIRWTRPRALAAPMDVEDTVRELLYGWHSGCVERHDEPGASAA